MKPVEANAVQSEYIDMNTALSLWTVLPSTSQVLLASTLSVREKPSLSLGNVTWPSPCCIEHWGLSDAVIKCVGVNLRNILGLMSCFHCSFSGFNYLLKAKSVTSLLLVNLRVFFATHLFCWHTHIYTHIYLYILTYINILAVSDL